MKQDSAIRLVEAEFVSQFSDLAQLLGNPPSYGAIYGLLFSTKEPLSMEQIIQALAISKGSASQGLRRLVEIGAIQRIKNEGDRHARYVPELELRRLLSGFLREQLSPRIQKSASRLEDLQKILPKIPQAQRDTTSSRLTKLSVWHQRAMATLPIAIQLLKDD